MVPNQHSTHDWLAETSKAEWATAREESRMGKSGYAPKKAELAEWVVEGRQIVMGLQEQLEASQRSIVTIGNAFIDWYQAEIFNSEAEAREEWQRIAVAGVSNPAKRPSE